MRRHGKEPHHEAVFPVYYLFPNIQLNVGGQSIVLVRVYPDRDNPHKSVSKVSFYHRPKALEDAPEVVKEVAKQFAEIIRDEDYAAAARTHLGATSGAIDHFTFGRNEPPLHHYHQTYRRMGPGPIS